MKQKDVTALIDGDLLIYKIAIGLEEPIQWEDDLWTLHADANLGKQKLDHEFFSVGRRINANKIAIALSSPNNFRKKISDTYKSNRKKTRKPIIYKPLLEYAHEKYSCFSMDNLEGDDVLGIMATAGEIDGEVIVVSSDKDMKTIPCNLLDPADGNSEIKIITKKQADYNFMLQTLTGDATDGYKGLEGVGEVTAKRILGEPRSLKLMWKDVVKAYEDKGFTKKDALTQSRLARILRIEDWNAEKKEPILWKP